MAKEEKDRDSQQQDLGTLTENPAAKRKPKKTKMDDGTIRTDY